MRAIFGSRQAVSDGLTPDAHAKVLLTKSNGAKRCDALETAASRCVNEPNRLNSTKAESKVWSAIIALGDSVQSTINESSSCAF
ncbi:hypothetical protein ACVIWV_001068 [Bradyrhizobium diazoefficiens]